MAVFFLSLSIGLCVAVCLRSGLEDFIYNLFGSSSLFSFRQQIFLLKNFICTKISAKKWHLFHYDYCVSRSTDEIFSSERHDPRDSAVYCCVIQSPAASQCVVQSMSHFRRALSAERFGVASGRPSPTAIARLAIRVSFLVALLVSTIKRFLSMAKSAFGLRRWYLTVL